MNLFAIDVTLQNAQAGLHSQGYATNINFLATRVKHALLEYLCTCTAKGLET